MNRQGRVLLLVGSAKKPRSTSEVLGVYLIERLREQGWEPQTCFLHQSLWTDERRETFLAATDRAGIVVLAFPLYVDTLPYLVTKALELLAQHRQANGKQKEQRLLCIVNCGFPEAHHNDVAIAICRRFARETGFTWAGGLAFGGGQAINGKPLRELGGMVRNAVKALDLTAAALAQGNPVPQEAIALMAKPFIPNWLYILFGGFGWKQQAKKYGTQNRLNARPYLR